MTLWEFAAVMDGLNEFHGGKRPHRAEELSDEQLADMEIEGFERDG